MRAVSVGRRIVKWTVVSIAALWLLGVALDLANGLRAIPRMRQDPPLEKEFEAIQLGMTKEEVGQILAKKKKSLHHYQMDSWSFSGPWYCYSVAFDPKSHVVVGKGKSYPPSCMADVEPRGLIVRWVWTKWDELR